MFRCLFLLCIIFLGCYSESNKVNTVAIISEKDLASDIFIFFGQDTSIGNVEMVEGKHFFNIEKADQFFFTKEDIGKGYIEFYKAKGKKKVRVYYSSTMRLNDAKDSSYQIVGGALRKFYDTMNKRDVHYITFKANYAHMLKGNWGIRENEVFDKYYNCIR
jgi:hypothetical protein